LANRKARRNASGSKELLSGNECLMDVSRVLHHRASAYNSASPLFRNGFHTIDGASQTTGDRSVRIGVAAWGLSIA